MDAMRRTVKRAAVATAGSSLFGVGVVMLVLPGPGLLLMIAGLAVLATEFAWAERHLHNVRTRAAGVRQRGRKRT